MMFVQANSDPQPPLMNVDKPLPVVPTAENQPSAMNRTRLPLTPRSTNVRTERESPKSSVLKGTTRQQKRLSKSRISRPLLQVSSSSSAVASRTGSRSEESSPNNVQPLTNALAGRTAIDDLGQRLEGLMAQKGSTGAAAQPSAPDSSKFDRARTALQRSRDVFARVKVVLHDRLHYRGQPRATTTASHTLLERRQETALNRVIEQPNHLETSIPDSEGISVVRLPLSSAAGPFFIPRKPVPVKKQDAPTVLEGNLSTGRRPHDRADTKTIQDLLSSSLGPVRPCLSFDGPWNSPESPRDHTRPCHGDVKEHSENSLSTMSGFSADISASSSYPGMDLRSSTPPGYSTPRIQCESRVDRNGTRKLVKVRSDTPSFLGTFDFESQNVACKDDPQIEHRSHGHGDGQSSVGLKRKSSHPQPSPSNFSMLRKKLKKEPSSQEIREENMVPSGLEMMGPGISHKETSGVMRGLWARAGWYKDLDQQ